MKSEKKNVGKFNKLSSPVRDARGEITYRRDAPLGG